jgi:predicted permease
VAYASAGYFEAMGIPLQEGRAFARSDPAVVPLEVIVSRALAERYWPGGRAEGKQVRLAPRGPLHTIVGVAGDVRGVALDQPPDETIYLPLVTAPGNAVNGTAGPARFTPREVAIVLRARVDPASLAPAVTRALRELDPGVPLYRLRPMSEVVAQATARTTFTLVLLVIASAIALVLGAVGLYGVIAYVVSLRTREIGVRMAFGAREGDVQKLVLAQGVVLAGAGIVLGLVASVPLARVVRSFLVGVSPTDPLTFVGIPLVLLGVAALASYLPARRASTVDPVEALRDD